MLTIHQLEAMAPHATKLRVHAYHMHLIIAMKEFDISTTKRQAAFMAQLLHESGSFRYMEEIASGAAYEPSANPKLAKKLGNINEGDGKRYKGRGPIQLTGRANYREAGAALNVPLEENPSLAADPSIGFRVAAWFWKKNGLNELADQDKFKEITKKINGGFNGLEDRISHWNRCKKVLGVEG